jgi:hypothetical protein
MILAIIAFIVGSCIDNAILFYSGIIFFFNGAGVLLGLHWRRK